MDGSMDGMELLERRVKPRRLAGEQPAEQCSRERCAGESRDGKGKPEAGLRQLSEAAAVLLLGLFVCAQWALVQLSVHQLLIGSNTGEFSSERAR